MIQGFDASLTGHLQFFFHSRFSHPWIRDHAYTYASRFHILLQVLVGVVFCGMCISPVYAARVLPPGTQPESKSGEAVGSFPELRGSGTLTFVNTGGAARLVTVCDAGGESGANSVTCHGIDVTGTFTGGPDGTAVFNTSGGEIRLPLADGKVFSFTSSALSMNFTVTDPSIFDAWVEPAETRDSGARVSDLSGQVEIACPPDLDAWDVLKMGRIILVDCHIKTGEDSKAVISFSDMTTFEMKPESEIVIDTPPQKESKLSLLVGNIWVNVKQMVKDGTMKVHMSQAVAGIKGTRFILTETGEKSTIEVTEGVVAFQSKTTGKEVTVSAGEAVSATKAGLSDKTTVDASRMVGNPQASSGQSGKNSSGFRMTDQKTFPLIGIGLVVGILLIIGITILRKRTRAT